MRTRPWLLLCLVGCGANARTTPVTTPAPDACEGAERLVIETPEPIAGVWSGALITGGHGIVTVRWCGDGAIVIDRMTLGEPGGASAQYGFDPARARLEHGQSFERDVQGPAGEGTRPLRVFAHDAAGVAITADAAIESVLPSDFVAERDACLAAHGTFAPAGLAGTFSCDRPTGDAGQRCLSDADCEGPCLDDHTEVTTSPPDARTCAPGQEVRLHVGICATHTLLFGCSPRLGAPTTECIVPGRSTRQHTTCVD